MNPIKKITVALAAIDCSSPGDVELTQKTFVGREAWLLDRLLDAGDRGVTTLENPAPRVSHYLMKIRRAGIVVETIREPHKGAYSGSHGRFILRSPVTVIEREWRA